MKSKKFLELFKNRSTTLISKFFCPILDVDCLSREDFEKYYSLILDLLYPVMNREDFDLDIKEGLINDFGCFIMNNIKHFTFKEIKSQKFLELFNNESPTLISWFLRSIIHKKCLSKEDFGKFYPFLSNCFDHIMNRNDAPISIENQVQDLFVFFLMRSIKYFTLKEWLSEKLSKLIKNRSTTAISSRIFFLITNDKCSS